MKTLKQVKQDNPQFSKLISSVINQLGGTDYIEDINNYGINGGFSGFIYYSDTHTFSTKNRKQIVELLEYRADNLGEDVVKMVSQFGVFRNSQMDLEDKKDLYKYISGGRPLQGAITNVMAWFAAEEVCKMFENN